LLTYVLITPARNEAAFIRVTLDSMVRQVAKPVRWVIVSDGSTDGTDEIVREYAAQHPWIVLLRTADRSERHFAGKVGAFATGYDSVKGLTYDAIGSLDADISFDSQYFRFLLAQLEEDPRLGVVGTPFRDESTYDYRFVSVEHVSGACQLFRRECFEEIGGYVPMKLGGIDHVAVITARMRGWKTRTFPERHCLHHRKMGSALHGRIKAIYRIGVLDYALGGHPVWEVFRAAYQATQRPRIVRGVVLYAGYLAAAARRLERPVSPELVAFRRAEQMRRLRAFALDRIPSTRRRSTLRSAERPPEGRALDGIASESRGRVQ
jgi:poly-beta-1,6-N-acetyl-D-glucosamine synthase